MRSRRVTGGLRTGTSDISKLRDRARRLLDLAQRASREGRSDYAALLTQLATEAEQAAQMERRDIDLRRRKRKNASATVAAFRTQERHGVS
jgi:hypothetical protein